MADLSQVNSPSDLIKYNDTVKPVDQVEVILAQVYECGPVEGKAIVTDIVETLTNWHKNTADQLLESDPEKAAAWIQDLTRLNTILSLLEDIAV